MLSLSAGLGVRSTEPPDPQGSGRSRLEEKVSNLQVRVTQIERDIGSLRLGVAELNGRVDSMEHRLERRSELVG
jgi:hypothetical protein